MAFDWMLGMKTLLVDLHKKQCWPSIAAGWHTFVRKPLNLAAGSLHKLPQKQNSANLLMLQSCDRLPRLLDKSAKLIWLLRTTQQSSEVVFAEVGGTVSIKEEQGDPGMLLQPISPNPNRLLFCHHHHHHRPVHSSPRSPRRPRRPRRHFWIVVPFQAGPLPSLSCYPVGFENLQALPESHGSPRLSHRRAQSQLSVLSWTTLPGPEVSWHDSPSQQVLYPPSTRWWKVLSSPTEPISVSRSWYSLPWNDLISRTPRFQACWRWYHTGG